MYMKLMRIAMDSAHWKAVILLLMIMSGNALAQDSLGMRRVATLEYWGASDIQMVGDQAYVLSGSSGLHIMDLSDPSNPVEIGRSMWYDWGWYNGGCYVTGRRAYIAAGGILVFDISDPTNPVRIGQTEYQELGDIFVIGDIAIVEGPESYPQIHNVADPNNIQFIGGFADLDYPASPIGMVGDYLCMRGRGLTIWDISDPTQPLQVASIDTQVVGDAAISGDYVFRAAAEAGFRVIDVSNPLQPEIVAVLDTGYPIAVEVTGTHAILSEPTSIQVWDIANPIEPVLEGTMETGRLKYVVTASGDIVCAVNYESDTSVAVLDISDPTTPIEVGAFGNNGYFTRMTIADTIGYVASDPFQVLDLSDPSEISVIARARFGGDDFAVYGNYGYMLGARGGNLVLDISDPAQPESLSCYHVAAQWIRIAGDYQYAVYGSNDGGPGDLHTLTMQNPTEPELVSTITVPNGGLFSLGFTIADGYIYYGGGRSFKVYSLANPTEPEEVGSLLLPGGLGTHISDIAINDGLAYVAYGRGGLCILGVGDPTNPTIAADFGGDIRRLDVCGNTLIMNDYGHIRVMNISNRLSPREVGFYDTEEWLEQVTIVERYLLTLTASQLKVYEIDALMNTESTPVAHPKRLVLHPCYPNPFNPSATIRFELPMDGYVQLSIYDITGRLARNLISEVLTAGEHKVVLNGTALPTGVYFARLEVGEHILTAKLMLLK